MAADARILVDARVGWRSGIGRYVANILPPVARQLPGAELTVLIAPEDSEQAARTFCDVPGIVLHPCPIVPFSLAEQIRLPFLAQGFDLTWFTNYWVPLGWRKPFVTTIHDVIHQEPELFPASRVKRWLSRRTFAHVAAQARGVVFISRFTQRAFERRFGRVRNGMVIHHGIDHGGWSVADPALSVDRERRLLVVASAKRHKNFAMLLRAWSRARLGEGWTLTIITPDQALRSSVDLAAMSSGAGRVELKQGLDDDALLALYRRSAIVATPSLYEGFGLPLLEGLAAGALCISSTAGALVEVAGGSWVAFVNASDEDGWVEAIERSCRAVDERSPALAPLAEAGRRWADTFTWERAATMTAALLSDALKGVDSTRTRK